MSKRTKYSPEEKIKIVNPMLWSPLNKSKQPLYRIELELYKDGNLIDEYSLKTGIRTLSVEKSCGPKFHRRWNDFQFILNSNQDPMNIRGLDSRTVQKLIVISGIIVSASKSQIKTSDCIVQCRNCGNIKKIKVSFL